MTDEMHYINNQELFKELMRRAHLHPEMFFDDQLDQIERLMRLVVKECCDVFVELRTRPADLAALDVKKHFGVE